jgi:hypothetical protein
MMTKNLLSWGIVGFLMLAPSLESFAAETNGGKEMSLKYCSVMEAAARATDRLAVI